MRPAIISVTAIVTLLAGASPLRAESDASIVESLASRAATGAGAHLQGVWESFALAPAEATRLWTTATAVLNSGTGVRAVTYALVLVVVGCGLEWLYWTFAAAPLRAVAATSVASPRGAASLALRRLGFLGFGLLLFASSTIGAAVALPWPPDVEALVLAATAFIVAVRIAWMLAHMATSPQHPALRVGTVPPLRSGSVVAAVVWLTALAATAALVPDLVETVGSAPHLAGAIDAGIGTVVALSLLALSCVVFGRRTGRGPRPTGWRKPRFPMGFVAAFAIVSIFAIWLAGGGRFAALLIDVTAAVTLVAASGRIVLVLLCNVAEGRAGPTETAPGVAQLLALSSIRFAVLLLSAGVAIAIVGVPLGTLTSDAHPLGRMVLRLASVAALAFAAHLAWVVIRFSIDRSLGQLEPLDPHGAPSESARLLTLLPLLRTTLAIIFAVLFGLSMLWTMGIQITPLLAGAGVFGLAIGFGAQALVRDVISGVFFLVEDVFRVGEYIESGSSTKGTVERITLRTVALRHHNGPLHFVPYGSLGTVRNNSRDWVIDKFNLPLPVNVDSEQIRKLIKRVGEAMVEDPDLAPLIREPLKGKLYRIDPGVKVFRCKFMTMPGRQFALRSAAFKMIEAALGLAGISFADATQTIVLRGPPDGP